MSDAVRVFRTAAFTGLATEIKRFGALSRQEALALFDKELVAGAMHRKVCAERKTRIGRVVYLLLQGRKLAGMTGAFNPSDEALMDAVCLRQAAQELERAGFTLDFTTRKRHIVYHEGDNPIVALAQHDGYTVPATRRLYRALIASGEYREMHIYTYLDAEELEALAKSLYRPVSSPPLDPGRLHLHRLVPPGRGRGQAASSNLN